MIEDKYKSLYARPFAQQVVFNIEQLNYRFAKLSKLDSTKKENHNEYLMVFDSFLVLFRAMFLENGRKQYSIQNFYREKGQEEVANEIDNYLDSKMFSWKEVSIRDVLKFIADKYICHIDPIEYEDLALANFYMSILSNPYADSNLKTIIEHIFMIINKSESNNS